MPAVARPRRSRHKLASSSSSEGEDGTGPPRPAQKRPRHSAPAQSAKAWTSGPADDRETATAGAGWAAHRAAVQGGGSAQSCGLGLSPPRGPSVAPTLQSALVPEECLAGDWLEDDLPLTHSRRGSRPPHPQSSEGSSRLRASGSGGSSSPSRPQARARQSRLPHLKGWSTPATAEGDRSSATEPPRSQEAPGATVSGGENPAAGQASVSSQACSRAGSLARGRWGRGLCLLCLSPFLPAPRVRACLPSEFEFEFRTVSSSSPSRSGEAAFSQPRLPLRLCGLLAGGGRRRQRGLSLLRVRWDM